MFSRTITAAALFSAVALPAAAQELALKRVMLSSGGIGYFGLSFAEENADSLKLMQVDGGDGCVTPTVETVQDGSYVPLGRGLFIYPSGEALQKPEVQAFINYYIDNAQSIAEAALFVPLTDEQLTEAQDKVASLAG